MSKGFEARRKAERKGRLAEWYTALFLMLKGYAIVRHRFSCPAGEIDLIAKRGPVLAFIEVKYRRQIDTAIEAVTPQARRRIGAASGLFLTRQNALANHDMRYDIVAVSGLRICHLRDAWRDGNF